MSRNMKVVANTVHLVHFGLVTAVFCGCYTKDWVKIK